MGFFKKDQLVGSINHVPNLRLPRVDAGAGTSLGEYSYPRNSPQISEEHWYDREFDIVWKMDDVDRTRALEILDFY